jgi:molybdopterin-guanine dinucleotide biosynthesis protein A
MIGALLAGGAGRRAGGRGKAVLEVGGRPLAAWPAAALAQVCDRVVMVAKSSSRLPELEAVERWDEPDEPRHPRTGIVHALERAGEPVLVCAADMPFVTPDACRSLITPTDGHAVVAVADGVLQPVLGVFLPSGLDLLREADADESLTASVERLQPLRVAISPLLVRSVNTKEELVEAEGELGGG